MQRKGNLSALGYNKVVINYGANSSAKENELHKDILFLTQQGVFHFTKIVSIFVPIRFTNYF